MCPFFSAARLRRPWSTHVRPVVGTETCQTRHVGYVLKGRVHVVLDDGTEFDISAGDVVDIRPGHDAWVLGDEPVVTIEWMGARSWIPRGGRSPSECWPP